MPYTIVLFLHSYVRWLVVIAALIAVIGAWMGWSGKRSWTKGENMAGMLFTMFLDIQVLLGLILFAFLSPITTKIFSGSGFSDSLAQYFTWEHLLPMVAALALAHIGRARSRRAESDQAKFHQAAIFYTLAVVLILIAIPWPFLPVSRPLIRF